MKVETSYQTVTVTDIPNPGKLTQVSINLQDGVVDLTYEGFVPYQPAPTVMVQSTGEAMELVQPKARYDGELDDPDHPRPKRDIVQETVEAAGRVLPRPVRDSPQA